MEERKGEISPRVVDGGSAQAQARLGMFPRSNSTPRRSSVGSIQVQIVPGVYVCTARKCHCCCYAVCTRLSRKYCPILI